MTTPEFFGVTKIDVEAFYTDRALVASKRSIGHLDLKKDSFQCVHPVCSRGDIRWKRPLKGVVECMKKDGKKEDTYSIGCRATNTDDGVRSCGAIYQFKVTVDYSAEKPSKPEIENDPKNAEG